MLRAVRFCGPCLLQQSSSFLLQSAYRNWGTSQTAWSALGGWDLWGWGSERRDISEYVKIAIVVCFLPTYQGVEEMSEFSIWQELQHHRHLHKWPYGSYRGNGPSPHLLDHWVPLHRASQCLGVQTEHWCQLPSGTLDCFPPSQDWRSWWPPPLDHLFLPATSHGTPLHTVLTPMTHQLCLQSQINSPGVYDGLFTSGKIISSKWRGI